MKKKWPIALAVVLILTACVLFVGWQFINYGAGSVCAETDASVMVEFEVKKGMTARAVGNELKERGLILNSDVFYLFARFPQVASVITGKPASIFKIQTGYYVIDTEMDMAAIFAELSSGKERSVTVSIPEGLTISKIAERLMASGLDKTSDFVTVATTQGKKLFASRALNIDSDSVEGFLYPDTYKIPLTYDSEKVIGLMLDNLLKQFKSRNDLKDVLNKKPEDFYKMMILASIVEREYRSPDEAASIAGVFTNRLKINMALQSCATVEYIITEIKHKPHPKIITYDDLEIESPYNTYKYPGLPPAPISNPGITSIVAAANPEKNDYLYFTLTDASAGRHTFSKNLNAHIKATNEFKTKRAAGN